MGKGNFIIGKALKNPDINYIGIEKFDSVMVRAVEKLEDMEIKNFIPDIYYAVVSKEQTNGEEIELTSKEKLMIIANLIISKCTHDEIEILCVALLDSIMKCKRNRNDESC